ncbi:helix-turn-helix domain-containing protein [Allocoprobacillus halotolerans]|uniref:Helix-turn-helix domain-containing protein n=1 Tax=Allocoprobacillus halotolerans TaxID=2944914 RepID=A0ABY5I209_9FIRM|nr:helix-turn-helix domain-containing protein [Allocoprobacillus halotolerans]UTY38980.1 helix-turn-helix domain-containing protein [Allocoprobacillus halotolerans]
MDNLGENIRQKRENRKMTIEDLSAKTKISVAVLRDIEKGKFDRYKGDEAYVKMYLKKISLALDMDAQQLTEQYIELTREIELEDLKEKEKTEDHNEEIVNKGKKFSFKTPQLARKPSVYEDKSHVTIIRTAIILVLVCFVIVVIWYGLYATRSQSGEPAKPENQMTVEGNVETTQPETPSTNEPDANNPTTQNATVQFTRNDFLDYHFQLPAGTSTFTLKIEYNAPCWAQMKVNDEVYDQFVSKIYHENEDSETETVELTFDVNDFESLDLRNGNNRGHRYYINNQEVPLTDEDKNTNQDRPVDLILTLEKE